MKRLLLAALLLSFLMAPNGQCGAEGTGFSGEGGASAGAGVGGGGEDAGPVDAGPICEPWSKRPCYSGPSGTEGVGACAGGFSLCNAAGTDWSFCEAEITPVPEDCATAADDDCDGVANEGCDGGPDSGP
jgi:hypothetical protein